MFEAKGIIDLLYKTENGQKHFYTMPCRKCNVSRMVVRRKRFVFLGRHATKECNVTAQEKDIRDTVVRIGGQTSELLHSINFFI